MSNMYELALKRVSSSLKSAEVAHAAKINFTEWSRFHVFDGVGQYIRGKNRGRLPYVSYQAATTDFTQETFDGNMEEFSFNIRIDVGGFKINGSKNRMETQANNIARAFLRELTNHVQWKGIGVSISELETTPWGGAKTVTVTHSFPDCDQDFNEGEDL